MDIDKAKPLEVVLLDGATAGPILLRLLSSDLVAIKVPRCDLINCKELFSAASVGIYFLFSDDAEPPHTTVYIGESESMFARLKNHLSDDSDWHTVVAFCAGALNKATIRFIEDSLAQEIRENGHTVTTQKTYKVIISEAQKLAALQFMKNVRELLDLFGFTPFAKVYSIPSGAPIFSCAAARGFPSSKGFTVLAGSIVSDKTVPSLIDSYKSLRDELSSRGIISECRFVQSYEFPSPSSAASVIMGCTTNGRDAWRLPGPGRKTLKEFQRDLATTD